MRSRALVSLAVIAGALAAAPQPAAAQLSLGWEVENRFRLYRDAKVFRDYADRIDDRMTVADLAGNPERGWIFRSEQKLQREDGAWSGWAAANLSEDKLCWWPIRPEAARWGFFRGRNDCTDYMHPVSHKVLLTVRGAPPGATCAWSVTYRSVPTAPVWGVRLAEEAAAGRNGSCAGATALIPYSTDAIRNGARVRVVVSTPAGSTSIETDVAVKDLLIVGLGDSFAAGVGNPDKPAHLGAANAVDYANAPEPNYPERVSRTSYAQFLDQRCFRSQYGAQFRAALHMAVALPHAAVTFVDLSCDGARVLEGLLAPKKVGGGQPETRVRPQLQALADALRAGPNDRNTCAGNAVRVRLSQQLRQREDYAPNVIHDYPNRRFRNDAPTPIDLSGCAPQQYGRAIDYLFLSIGGNDIGFAPMVMNALLADSVGGLIDRLYDRLIMQYGVAHDGGVGLRRLRLLPQKLRHLSETMGKLLPFAEGGQERVILSAYPLPVNDERGALCGSSALNSAAADCGTDAIGGALGGFSRAPVSEIACRRRDGADFAEGRPPPESGSRRKLDDVLATACALNDWRKRWTNGGLETLSGDEQGHIGRLCPATQPFDPPALQERLPWSVAMGTVSDSRRHGFCARDRASIDPNETLALPVVLDGVGPGTPYPIAAYRAYAPRQRWIRTTNDAFMTVNWRANPPLNRRDTTDNLRLAIGTSAMHPTAEGFANMADRLLRAAMTHYCRGNTGASDAEACRALAYR